MVQNMFFLDSELIGMGVMLSPRKTVCLFMFYAWFLKIILVGYDFFGAAIIRYVAKVYI